MSHQKLVMYHNPSCSKSRETLEILQQNQQDPEIIEYLDSPPSRQELERIVKLLGISPRELLRTGEPAYQDAKLDDETIADAEILDAICQFPILLQRPIIISGNKAVIGRPPVKVLDLIV